MAAVDFEVTQPKRVSKRQKSETLKRYLRESRQAFREEVARRKSTGATFYQRARDILNIDDVKAILNAKTSHDAKEILRAKLEANESAR